MDKRYGRVKWGARHARMRTTDGYWRHPLQWNNAMTVCDACGYQAPYERYTTPHANPITHEDCQCDTFHRARVFCASLSDWLDAEVPVAWLADLLVLIRATPNLDWLLLTKRPEQFANRMAYCGSMAKNIQACYVAANWLDGRPPPNVWVGTSVEDQERAFRRIPALLRIPAHIHFLSMEPLLEWVDVSSWLAKPLGDFIETPRTEGQLQQFPHKVIAKTEGVDWVIAGGESGPKARACSVDWIRAVVHQCRFARVPVFVKQLGATVKDDAIRSPSGYPAAECWPEGTKTDGFDTVTLQHRKGGDPAEWPQDLRVQQFPGV